MDLELVSLVSLGAAADSASLPGDDLGVVVVVDVVFLTLPELVIILEAVSSRLLLRFLPFAMKNRLADQQSLFTILA